jgi:3-dehydroquinate synthase
MKTLSNSQTQVEIGSITEGSLSLVLQAYQNHNLIIIVDENTHDCCLEYMITSFPELERAEVILLPVGEENKVMEVCFQVWQAFTEYGFGRKDLVINLGGGVVTDMGGFIASIFKRGLKFINIPTSLLGMVDAAIGGKTGIDLDRYKNQLGTFSHPTHVFIDPIFLSTLPGEEIFNGYAEMLKHAASSLEGQRLITQDAMCSPQVGNVEVFEEGHVCRNVPKQRHPKVPLFYSHSIVAGGLLDTS